MTVRRRNLKISNFADIGANHTKRNEIFEKSEANVIYAKIFSDGDDIVIDSVNKAINYLVYPAEEIVYDDGSRWYDPFIEISHTRTVAISPEAKTALKDMLSYLNPNFDAQMFEGNLKFMYNLKEHEENRGRLAYAPERGSSVLRINRYGKVRLCYQNGFDMRAFDNMKIFDNEFLKNLDISEPFDDEAYERTKK